MTRKDRVLILVVLVGIFAFSALSGCFEEGITGGKRTVDAKFHTLVLSPDDFNDRGEDVCKYEHTEGYEGYWSDEPDDYGNQVEKDILLNILLPTQIMIIARCTNN